MMRYQGIFIPSETLQETASVFLFLRGKTTEFRDTNIGDNSSLYGEARCRSAVALKDGFSQRLHGQHLGGRKDIKAFSQSWQKNTGKWVDPVILTKSSAGSARVPCFHAELQCCDWWIAGKAQRANTQLQLFKVDFWHCILVIFWSYIFGIFTYFTVFGMAWYGCRICAMEGQQSAYFPSSQLMISRMSCSSQSEGALISEFSWWSLWLEEKPSNCWPFIAHDCLIHVI